MPYIKIQTNAAFENSKKENIILTASRLVAEGVGKPESYVMTALEDSVCMSFGGSTELTVFMEVKSIGLTESLTGDLSKQLCDFAEEQLGVKKSRVYIEFAGAKGAMWGFNGSTF